MMHKMPRSLARVLLAAAAIAVIASTASVLSNLRNALGRRREPPTERERVREALKPILADIDWDSWHDTFGRLPENFDREAFIRSLPVLDPPLSQTIIEERDEERL